MNHKKIDKIGKVIVNAMMLGLLWAVIALPISSFSLVQLDTSESNVLSGQDVRTEKDIMPTPSGGTKAVREIEIDQTDDIIKTVRP